MIAQFNCAIPLQNSTTCSCCHIGPQTNRLTINNLQLNHQWVRIEFLAHVKALKLRRSLVSHNSNIMEIGDLPTSPLWRRLKHQFESTSTIINSRVSEISLLEIKNVKIPPPCDASNQELIGKEHEDFPLGRFMRFLKHLKIKTILKQVTDPRDPKKIKYRMELILQWVLTVFFFRCKSTNGFQTAFDKLPTHKRAVLWRFFGLDEGSELPFRIVVTETLSTVEPDEMNDILEKLFKWAMKSKVFYNHIGILLPDLIYSMACDGVWVHKYTHLHAKDEDGDNICPYCLPRVHNKGKENEYTDWLHAFVNVAFIFPGGLQLPIYIYPLKAEQLQGNEAASDEKHKQECELQAAHAILPVIKEKFPKLPIRLLADSLYANEPLHKLCTELGWEYLIVRQIGSLKNVAKQCDGLEKIDFYKEHCQSKQIIELKNGSKLIQTIKWFNRVTLGKDSFTNVLRFEEIEYDAAGKVAKNGKGQEKRFKTEWLCSTSIHKHNGFSLVKIGRLRADHEDLHNTLKNRGFAAKHDYARANPNACLIWKMLMFVSFWIFELFSFTKLAQSSKGKGSWMALAAEFLADLTKVPWEILSLSPSLQQAKIQFRFNFSP